MSQTKLCEDSPGAPIALKGANKKESGNIRITWLVLVSLQVIIALAIFQLFRNLLFASGGAASSNTYLSIVGCSLATICACLILIKYQKLIQDFSWENCRLEEKVGAQSLKLQKANAEMCLEIDERRRVEKALSESESRVRTIIREAALGIALIDQEGCIIEGNPALLAMLGFAPEELRGMAFTRISHPKSAAATRKIFEQLLAGQQEVGRIETRYIRKDGWIGWGRQSISLVRQAGGEPQFFIALCEDITERRESEEKIRTYQEQLRSLASELSLTEEQERRRLAIVLHDQIAQLLVLAKAKCENLQESAPAPRRAKPLEKIRGLIEESIRGTRSLIFELSPPILYDVGFEATMEWLADHMGQRHGLVVEVTDDDQPKDLDHQVRGVLFRVVQELLFNVLKHAHATLARVDLRRNGDYLRIAVEDNGRGFAPDRLTAASGKMERFGLFSIRERLNYFGGRMEIDSIPGQGTSVIMTIPLQSDQKARISQGRPAAAGKTAPPPALPKAPPRPPASNPAFHRM